MLKPIRKQANKLIFLQISIVVVLAILWWGFKDIKYSYSALLGGMACIFPSWYFIHKFFKNRQRSPQTILKDFYVGEMLKLFLSVVLLVLIVKYIPVHLLAVITGYIAACLAVWGMPFLLIKQNSA